MTGDGSFSNTCTCQKQRTETNVNLCMLCQEKGEHLVSGPATDSYSKVLESVKCRAELGDGDYPAVYQRLCDATTETLIDSKASWHRGCYQECTSKVKIDRARKRYDQALKAKDSTILARGKSRPSLEVPSTSRDRSSDSPSEISRLTRSSSDPFNRNLCFFCQTTDRTEQLHEVCTFNAGNKLKAAIELSENSIYKVRISTAISPNDARAIDVKYHLPCWITNVDRILQQYGKLQMIETENK